MVTTTVEAIDGDSTLVTGINGHVEPNYGRRLLPQVVDSLAETDPTREYAVYPRSSDLTHGFHHVTMRELAQAVNGFAFWLEAAIGRSTTFETVAYLGSSDIRYTIVLLAAIKCGYKLLVPSPKNAAWMTVSLLSSTGCNKFLCAPEMLPLVQTLKEQAVDLQTFTAPALEDMLQGTTKHFAYDATFEQAKWDPILVLHSSGSTGPPKPVVTNHAAWATVDSDRDMPTVNGRRNQNWAMFDFKGAGGRYFAAFPPFHLGGTMCLSVLPIYSKNATVVLSPAGTPPTGRLVSSIIRYISVKAIFAPPTILEQMCQEAEGLEQAKNLGFVLYAGGPLAEDIGNSLSKVTDVCQFYGSTETNGIPTLVPNRDNWAYFEFHPSYGVELQPSEDDAYELVLHRRSRRREDRVFSCIYPDVDEYHTRDLFNPHSVKPNLWKFHGRKDDIIILATGEKFNPVPSEIMISSHPLVSAALVVGFRRTQPALLIEPAPNVELDRNVLIDKIWPSVERANKQALACGRLSRSLAMVVDSNKPFERAGKGTVIRKMTAEKLASEIDGLYDRHSIDDQSSLRLNHGGKETHRNVVESIRRFWAWAGQGIRKWLCRP